MNCLFQLADTARRQIGGQGNFDETCKLKLITPSNQRMQRYNLFFHTTLIEISVPVNSAEHFDNLDLITLKAHE